MRFLANVKMKYKLLLVMFLPSLIMMGFISKFLVEDYRTLSRMDAMAEITLVAKDIGRAVDAYGQEENYSVMYLQSEGKQYRNELDNSRKITDAAIEKLRTEVSKVDLPVDDYRSGSYFDEINANLATLPSLREQVDNLSAPLPQVDQYYRDLKQKFLDKLSNIANITQDTNIARTLYAYVNLTAERAAAATEQVIIYDVLEGKQLDHDALLTTITEQNTYRSAFFEVALNDEDNIFRDTVKGPYISQTQQIRRDILKGTAVTANANAWWEAQAGKIILLQTVADKLLTMNHQESEQLRSASLRELLFTTSLIIITLLVTFVLVFFLLRSLTNQLQEEVNVLASSSQEIETSISQTSSGTAETASAVTETTTTVEELKQTAQVAADKARNVAEVSKGALSVLESSENALTQTIEGMGYIQSGMETITQSIIKLSEHSQTIGEIIDSVNDLAEQSHLLAVNAAIEAAKAGDQGKGFSVVAQEVRSLAEQSKQATVQVRNILNDIQNATSAAVMATEKGAKAVQDGITHSKQTNDSLKAISKEIKRVAEAASQITISSQQQLVGVEQVTIAMTNIKESSNQQVDHMKQIEIGMNNMNNVSTSLKDLVEEYRL
ncbi:MAG: methyl-accepting chemotaxis protein [Chlamydiales bacterium]|nr:methyl-accepting chemotaxis protein [Chlamydiales bacterium]